MDDMRANSSWNVSPAAHFTLWSRFMKSLDLQNWTRIGTMNRGEAGAAASWTAAALCRFSRGRDEAEGDVSPAAHITRPTKAPEDWRSPKPGGPAMVHGEPPRKILRALGP